MAWICSLRGMYCSRRLPVKRTPTLSQVASHSGVGSLRLSRQKKTLSAIRKSDRLTTVRRSRTENDMGIVASTRIPWGSPERVDHGY